MARTVSHPLVVPARQAVPNQVVSTSRSGGGLAALALAANSLWEEARGTVLYDYDPAGILTATGQVATWRTPTHGRAGMGTAPALKVWAYVEATKGLGTSIQLDFAAGASTWTWTSTAASTGGWVELTGGTVYEDSADYDTPSLTLTVVGTWTTTKALGISVQYARDDTALQAVTAGQASYANGVTPIDLSNLTSESPASTARLFDLHTMVRDVYASRLPVCITKAWVAGGAGGAANEPAPIRWLTSRPSSQTGCTYVLWALLDVTEVPDATVTVTNGAVSDADDIANTGGPAWHEWRLTIPAQSDAALDPSLTACSVSVPTDESVAFFALCAWYEDAGP
jgi:hypothetical protein